MPKTIRPDIRRRLAGLTIIYGPPASGKTIMAHAIGQRLHREGHNPIILDGALTDEAVRDIKHHAERHPSDRVHLIVTTTLRPAQVLLSHADVIVRTTRPAARRNTTTRRTTR